MSSPQRLGSIISKVSDPKNQPAHESAKVLAWPVSLVESNISRFPQPIQTLLFSEDPRNAAQIDETELRRKEAQMAVVIGADATRRAYESDLKSFRTFCFQAGLRSACPALPETLTLYLDWQATQGLAVATISRRLSAISREHRSKGFPNPCEETKVRAVLRNIRRALGTTVHPKTPINPDDLKAMLASSGEGTIGIRNRALLLTGFASGMRRSELVSLDIADVTSEPAGFRIHISRSKVDQLAKGRDVGVHRGQRKATCPVRALEAWMAARGRQAGPLFSHVLKDGTITGNRLSGAAVARVVKRTVQAVGLAPESYAGHSLRSGCATSAAAAGADILAIARTLGHASISTTERYVRHGTVFAVNALRGVL